MLSKEKNTKAVSVVSPPQVSALPPTLLIGSRRARLLTSSAALRSPQTCFRLPHCLGRFAPCGYSLPPALRRADSRLPPVIVLPLLFFLFIVVIVQIVLDAINRKGAGCSVVLLLLVFLYHISRQENVISLYTVLVQLRIWRLLIIPRFAEILGLPARPAVQGLRCRALTTAYSVSAVRG